MPAEPTLTELIASETDGELRVVLSHYLAAAKSLEAAGQRLGRMGHKRWQLACMSRSRDIEWQALRYMKVERLRSGIKIEDFREDLPTNPRGYPPHTGLQPPPVQHPDLPPLPPNALRAPRLPRLPSIIVQDIDTEVVNHHEAVFDTDRPPPKTGWGRFIPHERHQRIMRWCFDGAVLVLIVWALWLFKLHGWRLD